MTARPVIVRLLRWSLIGLVGLLLLLAALRVAAGTAPGRWLVASLLDGRTIAGQTIALEGLSGDPLSRFSIDRMTLADADGVWLDAETVAIDWRGTSLLFRPYEIDSLHIDRLTVERRPVGSTENDASSASGFPDLPALTLLLSLLAVIRIRGRLLRGRCGTPAFAPGG